MDKGEKGESVYSLIEVAKAVHDETKRIVV